MIYYLYILCTLYVYIIYYRGGTCVCKRNRQGIWPRCHRGKRCRCSQRCGRGAKCRNVIPGDPSACVCKCRIRTQNYVNGRSIEKATYDMLQLATRCVSKPGQCQPACGGGSVCAPSGACTCQGSVLEVAIGCTVNCRASAIIYRVLEFIAIIN